MATTETLEIKNYIGLTGDKPIRFIASDVDGTLVTDAKAIPEELLRRFVPLVKVASRSQLLLGRAWNEMNDVIEKIAVLALFSCAPNGAYVMDKDGKPQSIPRKILIRTKHYICCSKLTLNRMAIYVEAYVKDQNLWHVSSV